MIELFFDLVGFLLAGFLKIMFYAVLIIFLPLLAIGGICALFGAGFDWWREKIASFNSTAAPAPISPPSPPTLSPREIDALVEEIYRPYKTPILDEYIGVLTAALKLFPPTQPAANDIIRNITAAYYIKPLHDRIHPSLGAVSPLARATDPRAGDYIKNHLTRQIFTMRLQWAEREHKPMFLGQEIGYPHPFYDVTDRLAENIQKLSNPIPYHTEKRLEHTWICGTTGSGKSTLLKRLILHDLLADNPPALVIVDNQNELIPYVSQLDLFDPRHGKHRDKLYIFGRNSLPAINIFHRYTTGEEGLDDAISILRYMFTSLGVDLTGHQNLLFTPCARFLLSFPETIGRTATLDDLIQLLDTGMTDEYRRAAERSSDPINQSFMLGMFSHPSYRERKTELLTRLAGIKNEGYAGRLLSSSETRVNLYELLNDGAVILIDASGMGDSAPMFGRLCIAFVLQAIFARYSMPPNRRKETFCFVDEAHLYFDKNTQTLLTEARKFKLGGVFAHQQLADFKDGLAPYMTSQTSIRMVGRPSEDDTNAIARYLHTEPTLLHQPSHHFSTWIRGVTDRAVSVTVDAEMVSSQLMMDEDAYEELLRKNRERVSVRRRPAPAPPPKEPRPAPPPGNERTAGRTERGTTPREFRPETTADAAPRRAAHSAPDRRVYRHPAANDAIQEAAEEAAPYEPKPAQKTTRKRPDLKRQYRQQPPEDIDTST